jgi:hypothetical protein
MDGGIQNLSARATGRYSTPVWPAPKPTTFVLSGFWVVALLCGIGLAVAWGLSVASPCTGTDLNVGCVPIELTGQVAK